METDKTEQRLREKLEDAEFSLLMYGVAEAEGETLLAENERLKQDPEFDIAPALDAAVRESVSQTYSKKRRRESLSAAAWFLPRAAVVVLVCNVLFFALFGSASAFRSSVLRLVRQTFPESFSQQTAEDPPAAAARKTGGTGGAAAKTTGGTAESWLPAGYAAVDGEDDAVCVYRNAAGNELVLRRQTGKAAFDEYSGAANVSACSVDGCRALSLTVDGRQTLVWYDAARDQTFVLTADALGQTALERAAADLVRSAPENDEETSGTLAAPSLRPVSDSDLRSGEAVETQRPASETDIPWRETSESDIG